MIVGVWKSQRNIFVLLHILSHHQASLCFNYLTTYVCLHLLVLDNELFSVSGSSLEIDVYDQIKFSLSRQWISGDLIPQTDVAYCDRNKISTIYITDFKDIGRTKETLKVDLNGKLIKIWSAGDDFNRLSVTYELNVILIVYNKD